MNSINQSALSLLSSKAFQELTAYYKQTTLFNVIGAERSENRHSAFLRWMLSPDSSHGLGTEPLKLLLRLTATLKWGLQTFGDVLYRKVMAGNYELELLEPIEVEKSVGKLEASTKNTNKGRIDLWTVVCLTYEEDGEEMKRAFPIVVENKIYSKEGKDQTKRYYAAMTNYIAAKKQETGLDYYPIGVLLSPDGLPADCDQFESMTYQQLLDHVLTPITFMSMPAVECSFVKTYIHNLGRPSDNSNHDYTPLAISQEEKQLIGEVQQQAGELIDEMLVAVYGSKISPILGKEQFKEQDKVGEECDLCLLQELWDANEDVFKAVAYQKYAEKKKELAKLFKGNNRDTTKYRVCYGTENKEVFPGKRLSKAMAACAIFKAYLALKPQTTLEELRKAFPCKDINAYYWDNYYADLFYPYLPDQVEEHGEQFLEFTAEKRKGVKSLARWDFYMNGYQLLPLANGTEKSMCVKMWRRGDFDRLIDHLQEMKETITVEECL